MGRPPLRKRGVGGAMGSCAIRPAMRGGSRPGAGWKRDSGVGICGAERLRVRGVLRAGALGWVFPDRLGITFGGVGREVAAAVVEKQSAAVFQGDAGDEEVEIVIAVDVTGADAEERRGQLERLVRLAAAEMEFQGCGTAWEGAFVGEGEIGEAVAVKVRGRAGRLELRGRDEGGEYEETAAELCDRPRVRSYSEGRHRAPLV